MIDDVINEYLNTRDYAQQKLNEKCNREGIPIDKVILFFSKFKSKIFL